MILKRLVALALLLGLVTSSKVRSDQITPEGAALMNLDLAGKISPYHRLSRDSVVLVAVSGPGRLDLIVRLSFPSERDTNTSYQLEINEGQTLTKTFQGASSPTTSKWLSSMEFAGDSKKYSLDIPDGDHRFAVKMTSSKSLSACARFLYYPKTITHKGDSDLYPVEMAGTTTIAFKEKLLDFFIADQKKPVVVEVIGPTKLRAVTRLAYSGTMKGPQKYSVDVSLDGHSLRKDALATEKAVTSDFTNHREWSVGESRTIYVPIPAGKHRVGFLLSGCDAPALAVRFTIPKEDVKHSAE